MGKILIAILLVPSLSVAQEAGSVLDLQFIPKQGQHFVQVGYLKQNSATDLKIQNINFIGLKSDFSALALTDTYGLTPNAQLGLGVMQSMGNSSTLTYGPASTLSGTKQEFARSGTYDPFIRFGHRWLKQEESSMNFDFVLTYSPKIMAAKSPSTDRDGTVGRGGDYKVFSVTASKVTEKFQFAGLLQKTFYGTRTLESQTSGTRDTEISAFGSLDIGVQGLVRINDFFFGLNLTLGNTDSYDETSGATKIQSDSSTSKAHEILLKYEISQNSGLQLSQKTVVNDDHSAKIGTVPGKVQASTNTGTTLHFSILF